MISKDERDRLRALEREAEYSSWRSAARSRSAASSASSSGTSAARASEISRWPASRVAERDRVGEDVARHFSDPTCEPLIFEVGWRAEINGTWYPGIGPRPAPGQPIALDEEGRAVAVGAAEPPR